MHHLVSTGLRCAPPTCLVHHQPALCTMVHKGDLSNTNHAVYYVRARTSMYEFVCTSLYVLTLVYDSTPAPLSRPIQGSCKHKEGREVHLGLFRGLDDLFQRKG